MTADLLSPLTGALAQNVIFGALIGVESMYVLTRSHQNGSVRLWVLLLPLLVAVSFIGRVLPPLLAETPFGSFFPLFITVVSAAGALLLQSVHRRYNRRAHEKEYSLLFFASMAALLIAAAWWKTPHHTLCAPIMSAVQLWTGYGLGLLCFVSIGAKLHYIAPRSRLAGMALLFLALALIGLALNGVGGLGR